MNAPIKTPTPEEHTPEYIQAQVAMNTDAETIVGMVLKELATRSEHYNPEDNKYFKNAEAFLLDFVMEKLHQR